MGDQWYSPGQIQKYTRPQVIWLIQHLPSLRGGDYPTDHKETGYTGRRKKKVGHHAYFENAVCLAGEIDKRIENAGLYGILVEYLYTLNPADQQYIIHHISKALGRTPRHVHRSIKLALRYLSGKERKPEHSKSR